MHDEEILRPASSEDGPSWYQWRSEGREGFIDGLSFSLDRHKKWFAGKLEEPSSRLWMVLQDGRSVGMIGLTNIDHRHQTAELAWVYVEPAARGIGAAAVRAVVGLAFRELNLHRIHLSVLASNARALRCYEKVGFRAEGRLREAAFKSGKRHDIILMALLRPEFDAQAEGQATSEKGTHR